MAKIPALLFATLLSGILVISVFASNLFTEYDQVRPILNALSAILPSDLKAAGESTQRKAWSAWLIRHDHEIRGRLERGDEDTLVNWLLFGTTFTNQPRALFEVAQASDGLERVLSARIKDLVAALALTDAAARGDERRVLVRTLLRKQGYRFDTVAERSRLEQHLRMEVERVLTEQRRYQDELDAVRRSGDVAREVTAESTQFRERGISLDTSIFPGFAIEQALEQMLKQKLVAPGAIRRVAVVGPGLDFSDKNSGYDFYPLQTLQPFTVIDSLVRLGLASNAEAVEVTTFDISSRVNQHVQRLSERGKQGTPYVLRLPFDTGSPWTSELRKYWKDMGDRVGIEVPVPKAPSIGIQLDNRGIRVQPQIAAHIAAVDFNVVTERWHGQTFDLVVTTNVLAYYDRLDQSFAFAGIEAMLRPGGYFLTNNAVVELPVSRLRATGFATVRYSDELKWFDHVFWYRRTS